MLRNIFLLAFALCAITTIHAQTIYLKMDDTCMERFEYSNGDDENPYVSYSFKLGDKKFANLDVGLESKKWVSEVPGKITQCNALNVDKEFVQKLNDGKLKLYVVQETNTHYHVAGVDKASFLQTSNGTMEYLGDDAAFSLYLNNPVSGVNLAMPGSKSEFYLEGTINYQCLKGYILQKKEDGKSKSFKEYVVVPEIGFVAKASISRTGFTDELVRDNEYNLLKVNSLNFKNVLSDACDKEQAKYYDGVTSTQSNTPSSYDQLSSKSGKTTTNAATPTSYGNNGPCGPSTEQGTHIVQKGETLYAISRKYGVPVAQLASWNNLANGNVISLCQKLWVKQPSGSSTSGSTTSTTGSTSTEKGTETDANNTGYWTKSAAEHQVRSGETVASLAKMYGYTEERFRKMNGLSATEAIRAGQRLRTSDCNCPTLETSTKDAPLPYDQQTEVISGNGNTETTTPKAIDNKDVFYRPITVHLVKSTDTWFSIAKQYNTTVERIWELNGMGKNDKLVSDQRIYVQ